MYILIMKLAISINKEGLTSVIEHRYLIQSQWSLCVSCPCNHQNKMVK